MNLKSNIITKNTINNSYQFSESTNKSSRNSKKWKIKIIEEKIIVKDINEREAVLQKILNKQIKRPLAAKMLGISTRQLTNIIKRYKQEWLEWLIHKALWKPSNHQSNSNIMGKMRNILHDERLNGCKPTYVTEKLRDFFWIDYSKETIRKAMIKEDLWIVNPKKLAIYKTKRARRSYYWELSQFDWSYHRRIEIDETKYCLLLDVDDATWKIMHAKLWGNEGYEEVAKFRIERIKKHGAPRAIYLDGFSTYKISTSPNATKNDDFRKKFDHAMRKLWCQLITAKTPWAKWRVERYNWILQDRLVKDLKFMWITDIDMANKFIEDVFIPKYNEQFAVKPALPDDIHIKLSKEELNEIDRIFAIENERSLWNDFIIQYKGIFYQLSNKKEWHLYPKKKLLISETLNWQIRIHCNSNYSSQCVNYEVANKEEIKRRRWKYFAEKLREKRIIMEWRAKKRAEERLRLSKERKYQHQAERLLIKMKMKNIAEWIEEIQQ